MSNSKQLGLAWVMYAGENSENLAVNSDLSKPYNGTPSWITGSPFLDWLTGSQNTNTANLVDDQYSLLGNNLGRNYQVFACPAANFVSSLQRSQGWDHRCRSVAMNASAGAGSKSWKTLGTQYSAKKSSDFHTPGRATCGCLPTNIRITLTMEFFTLQPMPRSPSFMNFPAASMAARLAFPLPMATRKFTSGKGYLPTSPSPITI